MAKICRVVSVCAALTLAVTWLVPSAVFGAPEVQAPYRVEKYTQTSVTVDFGTVDPSSNKEQFGEMTLLTASGPEPVTLKEFDEVCVHLCGEPSGVEGEEEFGPTCHFVGLYERPVKTDGGDPFVALPGRIKISAWMSVEKTGSGTGIVQEQWIADSYKTPVGGFAGDYRWAIDYKTGDAVLMNRSMGPDFYAPHIELKSCELGEYRNFLRLNCGSNADLLYSGSGDLLILSLGEYGNAAAQPIVEFSIDDVNYALVRVGLKAHVVYGLLTRIDGQWKLLIRPVDYPLMC
jgi:hypothetical protein